MDFPVDLENAVTSIEERLDMTAGNTKVLESGDIESPYLWDASGEYPFFHMRSSAQSGFFQAETLKKFYRNIRLKNAEQVDTCTLDSLLQNEAASLPPAEDINWLSISHIWSAKILEGAKTLLRSLDVIVLKAPQEATGDPVFDACLQESLDARLQQLGFLRLSSATERHSAFVQLLFARDWKSRSQSRDAQHQRERTALESEIKTHGEKLAQTSIELNRSLESIESLRQSGEEAQKLAEQSKSQLEKQLADTIKQRDDAEQTLKSTQQALNENKQLAEQSKSQLEKQLADTTKQRDDVEQALKSTQQALSENKQLAEQSKSQLEKQLADTTKQRDDVEQALKSTQQALSENKQLAEQSKSQLEKQLADTTKQRDDVEQALKSTQQALSENKQLAEQSKSQLEKQLADTTKQRDDVEQTLKSTQQALSENKQLAEQSKSQLEKQLAETTKQRDVANATLISTQNLLSEANKQQAENNRAEVQELVGAYDSWKKTLGDTQQAFTAHKASTDAANSVFDAQKEQLTKIESQLNSTRGITFRLLQESRLVQLAGLEARKDQLDEKLKLIADDSYNREAFSEAAEYFNLLMDRRPKDAYAVQGFAESVARMDIRSDPYWFSPDILKSIRTIGKWDVAVRHYRKALSLDPQIGQKFAEAHPPQTENTPNDNKCDPVFIVGCGHSGTSIMLRILGEHPDLWPIHKESALFLRKDQIVYNTMREWDEACLADGAKRWIEKTPPHIFQMKRFLMMRPKAQFILMLRDGRDVVSSLRSRVGYEDVQDRIDRWVYDNMAGLPLWDHPQVKVVHYEDFVENPVLSMDEISSFLNLQKKDSLLDYHQKPENWYSEELKKPDAIKNQQDHNNLRNWQVNQPLFDGRGKWKDDMSASEKQSFKNSIAQEFLEQFGYRQEA